MNIKKIVSLINSFVCDLKEHWNTPAKKKYVPYKEIAAYSVGGVGVQFVACIIGYLALNAGSMLVGASIGIKVVDMQTISVVASLIGIITAPTRAMLFDNTKSKMGKFRPYLLYMGFPSALLYLLFVYLPYETMEYSQKFMAVLIIYNLIQFCSPFYTTAYTALVNVMSPDTNERAWVIEISAFIYSLAPTIINPVMPLIGPLDSLRTYRISGPIFCLIGLAMSMICVFGTREKVIVPKRYVPQVSFFDGMKKVFKNKYFWIINLPGWLGFLSGGYGFLFQWIFYYGMGNAALFSLMTLIRGEASVPGMLLGAPLVNKFGKKKVCLFSMAGQIVCLVIMLFCFENYILAFIMMFLKDIFGAVSIVYSPAMKADVIDYQQYKTGDRLEGFIDQVGVLIGSVLGLGTGYVIPLVLQRMGLENNFNDLYDPTFRNPIVKTMILMTLIGTATSVIPYLFYDLSDEKRGNMIKVLKLRALFADYHHNELTDEHLVDTVSEVKETLRFLELNKDKEMKNKKEKEELIGAQLLYKELHKFESDDVLSAVKNARDYVLSRTDIVEPDASKVTKAMNMPDETRQQRKERRKAVKAAENEMKAFEKSQKKYTAAKKLLTEYESYGKWEEILQKYELLTAAEKQSV